MFLALFAAGCPVEELGEPLSFSILKTCLKVPQPTEQTFRTSQELRDFYARYGAEGSEPSVDFSRFVVAARFDGAGSGCLGFTVEAVEARDGAILIHATRHLSTRPCIAVLAYPQIALAVERRDLPVVFRIRDARDEVPGQTAPCF